VDCRQGGLAPQILVGIFFKGPFSFGKNGQSVVVVLTQKKKRSLNKNYRGQLPLSKQKLTKLSRPFKKKKKT
jgi:hypothetical protein